MSKFKKDGIITSPLATGQGAGASRSSDITPIRGTKRGPEAVTGGGARKRLNNTTPMQLVPLGEYVGNCMCTIELLSC